MISRRLFLGSLAALPSIGQKGSGMFADAEAYEKFMGRWSRLVAPLLVDFGKVADGGQVLDVGSGSGSLASAIAKRKPGVRVVGVDPSEEYTAFANSRNPFPERVRFEVGDAQDLKFADSAFGSTLSLLVFNFIPDPQKALGELRRVTQAGGWISAAVWDYGGSMEMLRTFWDAAVSVDRNAEARDERHMPLCRAGELSALWNRGGLRQVSEEALEVSTDFHSFADYWDPFLLGQGPAGAYVRSLPVDAVGNLREAVKRRLSVSDETQPFRLRARVWAVRGIVPAEG